MRIIVSQSKDKMALETQRKIKSRLPHIGVSIAGGPFCPIEEKRKFPEVEIIILIPGGSWNPMPTVSNSIVQNRILIPINQENDQAILPDGHESVIPITAESWMEELLQLLNRLDIQSNQALLLGFDKLKGDVSIFTRFRDTYHVFRSTSIAYIYRIHGLSSCVMAAKSGLVLPISIPFEELTEVFQQCGFVLMDRHLLVRQKSIVSVGPLKNGVVELKLIPSTDHRILVSYPSKSNVEVNHILSGNLTEAA